LYKLHFKTGYLEAKKTFYTCVALFLSISANQNELPHITATQLNKLRHLTIVSLAAENKVSSYVGVYGSVVNEARTLKTKAEDPHCQFQ